MKMNFVLKEEEIKEVKNMLMLGFDEIEKYLRDPDPKKRDRLIKIIHEQKRNFTGFLNDTSMISITVEKKVNFNKE